MSDPNDLSEDEDDLRRKLLKMTRDHLDLGEVEEESLRGRALGLQEEELEDLKKNLGVQSKAVIDQTNHP
ncbi:hypothetical protein HDU96_003652, partial [Phlyctochytrium bullatum]